MFLRLVRRACGLAVTLNACCISADCCLKDNNRSVDGRNHRQDSSTTYYTKVRWAHCGSACRLPAHVQCPANPAPPTLSSRACRGPSCQQPPPITSSQLSTTPALSDHVGCLCCGMLSCMPVGTSFLSFIVIILKAAGVLAHELCRQTNALTVNDTVSSMVHAQKTTCCAMAPRSAAELRMQARSASGAANARQKRMRHNKGRTSTEVKHIRWTHLIQVTLLTLLQCHCSTLSHAQVAQVPNRLSQSGCACSPHTTHIPIGTVQSYRLYGCEPECPITQSSACRRCILAWLLVGCSMHACACAAADEAWLC